MSDGQRTIGDLVRGALAVAGVTQARAAAELGISQSQLSRRIRGRVKFRADELPKIAALCRVPVASLVPSPTTEAA